MLEMFLGQGGGGYCDRLTRRQALRIGGSGLLGGLTLPSLLEMQATAATRGPAKAKACILLFLNGGPSHIDMWDLKPNAPDEIRGPFKTISTSVPGTQIGHILPYCAQIVDKFTIMRSHSHADNGHATGMHWCLTGYPPSFSDGQQKGMPYNELYPSMGSIISRELGSGGAAPPYIEMPNPLGPGGPGFYGANYAPFTVETDPVQPDFKVRDMNVVAGIGERRFELRRRLLREANLLGSPPAGAERPSAMTTFYDKAMDLVTSPEARRAFDMSAESDQIRERYGYTSIGQCSLLARRLVEAGCRFIGIDHGSWDTHFDNFTAHENSLCPPMDRAFSTLVTDLDERGMLDETLVVMMGEMGRRPTINKDAGRDHWSQCQSVIFAGGGTKRGVVIGATDETASYPITRPYGIQDLWRTVFHLLGIDSEKTYETPLGRPVPIVNGGHIIDELLA